MDKGRRLLSKLTNLINQFPVFRRTLKVAPLPLPFINLSFLTNDAIVSRDSRLLYRMHVGLIEVLHQGQRRCATCHAL